jgi:hypothetical protein
MQDHRAGELVVGRSRAVDSFEDVNGVPGALTLARSRRDCSFPHQHQLQTYTYPPNPKTQIWLAEEDRNSPFFNNTTPANPSSKFQK